MSEQKRSRDQVRAEKFCDDVDPVVKQMEKFSDDVNQDIRQIIDEVELPIDPKKEAGSVKPSVSNCSPVAEFFEGAVQQGGAETYGEYNWADHNMEAKTYYNAIRRHLAQWWLGEDDDEKSGLPHMAHIRASCAILIEQQALGKLIDNRPKQLASIQGAFDIIEVARKKKK